MCGVSVLVLQTALSYEVEVCCVFLAVLVSLFGICDFFKTLNMQLILCHKNAYSDWGWLSVDNVEISVLNLVCVLLFRLPS